MAIYKYLGYGVTNSKGKAKLDHDKNGDPITHSYTGTGAGELDIIASLDNPSTISDSSIQSEIYELYDVQYKDLGGSKGNDTDWTVNGMTVDRTTDSTCTILTQTTASTFTNRYLNIGKYTNRPLVIEADISIDTGSDTRTGQIISVRYGASSTGSVNWNANNLGTTTTDWHHIKIEIMENTATLTIDNTTSIPRDITVNPNRFYFILNQDTSNSVIKYRNLIVY